MDDLARAMYGAMVPSVRRNFYRDVCAGGEGRRTLPGQGIYHPSASKKKKRLNVNFNFNFNLGLKAQNY